jgi:hypothetical protein
MSLNLTDVQIFQVAGASLAVIGLVIFVAQKSNPTPGENTIHFLGLKISLSTPYLVVFVFGVLLFIFPFTEAFTPHTSDSSSKQGDKPIPNTNPGEKTAPRPSPPQVTTRSEEDSQQVVKPRLSSSPPVQESARDSGVLTLSRERAIGIAREDPRQLGVMLNHTTFYPNGTFNLRENRFVIDSVINKLKKYPGAHLYIVSQWSPPSCGGDEKSERANGAARARAFEAELRAKGMSASRITPVLSNYYAREKASRCDNDVFHFVDFYAVRDS